MPLQTQAQAGQPACDLIDARHVDVQALPNTPDETMYENIRINSLRPLPWVAPLDAHDKVAVICGGGASLAASVPEIIARARDGQHIFAINGAAEFLSRNGVKPGWFITMDPRPQNVDFVKSRPALRYLLASNCAPELFDELKDEDIGLLHPAGFDKITDYLPRGKFYAMGGGITTGLTALAVLYTLGYREIHLFGYDSSDTETGAHHAYGQGQTEPEKRRLQVHFGGKIYLAQFAMYKQAMEFPRFAMMLADLGVVLQVHGEGLLPAIAHEMAAEKDYSCAIYDFTENPCSFDFVIWLMTAEMTRRRMGASAPLRVSFVRGPNKGFRNDGLPDDIYTRERFFENVIKPSLSLIGAVEDDTIGDRGYRPDGYVLKPVVEAVRNGEQVPRLTPSDEARAAVAKWLDAKGLQQPVVIILREAKHWPERNSKFLNWWRFAGYLKSEGFEVVFVRDTENADEPMPQFHVCAEAARDLHFRIALYERAKCVIGSAGGATTLPIWMDTPALLFVTPNIAGYPPSTDEWWRNFNGIGFGEQLPWTRPDQLWIWDSDNYPAIRKAWDQLNLKP